MVAAGLDCGGHCHGARVLPGGRSPGGLALCGAWRTVAFGGSGMARLSVGEVGGGGGGIGGARCGAVGCYFYERVGWSLGGGYCRWCRLERGSPRTLAISGRRQLGAGRLLWASYLSTEAVPHDLPKQPIALFGRPQKRFVSPTELFAFVRSASLDCQIDKIEQSNPLALRLKDKIDRDFSSNKSFQDFADELRVSHSAMTRAFRRCFDISPIAYRNKMRIFEAMSLLLLKGERSVEACFDVGFVDISRFNRQFKRQMKSVPSQYNSCKKNSLDR